MRRQSTLDKKLDLLWEEYRAVKLQLLACITDPESDRYRRLKEKKNLLGSKINVLHWVLGIDSEV